MLACSVFITGAATLAQPGVVLSEQKISDLSGGFTTTLIDNDRFGEACENIGDLNDDGVDDLAVGAVSDDDGGSSAGAVYILFMNSDGTVASEQKISALSGGFTGPLAAADRFGSGIAALGDLNGDGVEDIAVGASGDDTGGSSGGAVYILFMNTDGTVASEQKIAHGTGGFSGDLASPTTPEFGVTVCNIGDLDNDGITDLAVGAFHDDELVTNNKGAVYILFMNTDGTVSSDQKISPTVGGFTATIDDGDEFGYTVTPLGDLNGDSKEDIAVGARLDDDGGTARGAVYILFLETDGTVISHQKIASGVGGFGGLLDDSDYFGTAVGNVGDVNQDGVVDIAVGVRGDDDGFSAAGAVWITFLNSDGTVFGEQKISATEGSFTGPLETTDEFGFSVTGMGDLNGDGGLDLAVGARYDDDGGPNRGAVYILFMDACNMDAAFTVDDAAPCPDVVVNFTNTSVNTGTVSYEWLQDGSSVAATTDHSQDFPSGGDYVISLVTSKFNCANDTANMTISVLSNTFGTIDTTVCLSYTVPSGDETHAVSGSYNDTIPNAAGCDSIISIVLTIAPDDPTFSYTAATYCSGDADPTPTITGTLSGTFSASPAGLSINASTGAIDLSASTAGVYDVKYVTSSADCPDSSTVSITINESPSIAFVGTTLSGCGPLDVSFTGTSLPAGDLCTWYFGDGGSTTGCGTVSHTYTSAGTFTVSYVVDASGCTDSIATVDYITVNASPTPDLGADILSCDTVVILDAGAGMDDYLWSTTEGTQTIDVTADGEYIVTVTLDGCEGADTINVSFGTSMSTIDVSVCESYTVPSGDETYTSEGVYYDTIPNAVGCDSLITINLSVGAVDTSVIATDTSLTANAPGATYQWIDCATGDPIAGATDATFIPSEDGAYAVIVTEGSCSDTSSCYEFHGLGINEIAENWFVVYPNPTKGTVTVKLSAIEEDVVISLYDMSGRLLFREQMYNIDQYKFPIEGEPGMYLVEVSSEDGRRKVSRVIKR